MATIKTEGFLIKTEGFDAEAEGFKVPNRIMARPDMRRPFSDGSLAVDTSDLTSVTPMGPPMPQAFQYNPTSFSPTYAFSFEQPMTPQLEQSPPRTTFVGKAPRIKQRKLSMNEARPRERVPLRAMSFSHADKMGLGISFDSHHHPLRPNSISPPEYYGMAIPQVWDSGSSVPSLLPSSMQSYGTAADDAILDSPATPARPLSLLSDDEQKKQRRRECHNLVEKRRREHINAKIEELSLLLPPQYSLDEAIEDEEEEQDIKKKKRSGSSTKIRDAAQCKGHVLTQSVAYIHDLRHITQAQAARIQQLESWLASSGYPQTAAAPSIVWEQRRMEPMQPSPDAEPLQSMNWPAVSQFEISPRDYPSSGSSHSFAQPSEASPPSPAEQAQKIRSEMEAELPISMSGIELDSIFARRDDDHGGMRW